MTFHSRIAEDMSPVNSEASLGRTESPQLVARSLGESGESYVVIAGSKPLSIIIKKCILPVSLHDFNNFHTTSQQCSANGHEQLPAQESTRCSQDCLEIACVSDEKGTDACSKSAELRLDSISRSINECGAIADGSAICEIDCGLVNEVGPRCSGGTCSQQDDNDIPVNDADGNSDEVSVIIEPDQSSAYSAVANSSADAYLQLESDTNAETLCTSESEVYLRSDENRLVIESDLKRADTQLRSIESGICDNLKAVLVDENAVSSLSPSYTFYGAVEGISDVAESQDKINDSVLQDTCISSADSPASPVLGSASKSQKVTRTRRCETDSHEKVKFIDSLQNHTRNDTVVCSYQRSISHCYSREGGRVEDHIFLKPDSANVEAVNQSLKHDRRNFIEIGVLSMGKQKSVNRLEISHQEASMKCDKDSVVDDNLHNVETDVFDNCVIGGNFRNKDETCYHQNLESFSAGHKNLSPSESRSDYPLSLETCFRSSRRIDEVEKFNVPDVHSSTVTNVNCKNSVQTIFQEKPLLLLSAGVVKTNNSSMCFKTSIHSADDSSASASKQTSQIDRNVIIPDMMSSLDKHEHLLTVDSDNDYVFGKQVISSNGASEDDFNSNECFEELRNESQLSSLKEHFTKLKVPVEQHEPGSSHLQKHKQSQNSVSDMLSVSSEAVHVEDDKEPSENLNEICHPYTGDAEESCTHSDSMFEDFCFDSVKEFSNDYFDRFMDSPILDTSKMTDRSRCPSVCDKLFPDIKVEHVRNDIHMNVGDNNDCGETALQEPKFSVPQGCVSDNVGVESKCNSASQWENSPLLFASDDENSDSQWESSHTVLKENKFPVEAVTSGTVHNIGIEALHEKLQKIQELLLGIPPPPSITMPNHTVEEMLRLINQNEHLMVQKLFKSCGSLSEEHSVEKKGGALRDVLNTSWPQIKDCDYFDIQYNHGAVSEELDRQYQRLQERFVGRETASSCTPWFTTWNASKSSVRYQRSLGQSPGSRLSHLARRRQSFSSSNLQPASVSGKLPGAMHRNAIERRVIMVDAKKEEKQQKHKLNNRRLQRNTICIGEDDSRLKSSRRALFQSPVDDRKASSYLKSRTESHNMKTDAWGGVTKYTENRGRSVNENFNINGKRVIPDPQSHPRKISRKLVFDASQTAGHSFSHNTEFNTHSSVSSQLMERKSNSSYINGNHRSQVHTQHLPSSQAASKSRISGTYKKKLLWAVAEALRRKGITMNHHRFHPCASSLTKLLLRVVGNTLCVQPREDTSKTTSEQLLETALQHVHTVVQKTEAAHS